MFALLFLAVIHCNAGTHHIVDLTEKNFFSSVENGLYFVELFVSISFSSHTASKLNNVFDIFFQHDSFSPDCGHCKKVAPTYEAVSNHFQKFKDNITIARVDCSVEGKLCDLVGIDGHPTFRFYDHSSEKYTNYEGDRSFESFKTEILASMGVVYKPKLSFVTELTPGDFDRVVMDPTKNVLVAFTAKWCAHCKKLAPQLEIVGLTFKEEDNVTIAKIDADKYKDFCEPYNIPGYPTLRWFPAYNEETNKIGAEAQAAYERIYAANHPPPPANETNATDAANTTNTTGTATATTETAATNPSQAESSDDEDEKYRTPIRKGGVEPRIVRVEREALKIIDWINVATSNDRRFGGTVGSAAGIVGEMGDPIVRLVHAVTHTNLPPEAALTPEQYQQLLAKREEARKQRTQRKWYEDPDAPPAAAAEPVENATAAAEEEDRSIPPPPVTEARAAAVAAAYKHVRSPYVREQYLRYIDALDTRGLEFLEKERARLDALLKHPQCSDRKLLELVVRRNVLQPFQIVTKL